MTTDPTSVAPHDAPLTDMSSTTLDLGADYITIINTYTVTPERAEELLAMLVRSTNETLRYMPGFVSANFHMSLDRTQLVNYAQWQSHDAIKAAGANPRVQELIREVSKVASSFTPIHYELRNSVAAATRPPLKRGDYK